MGGGFIVCALRAAIKMNTPDKELSIINVDNSPYEMRSLKGAGVVTARARIAGPKTEATRIPIRRWVPKSLLAAAPEIRGLMRTKIVKQK